MHLEDERMVFLVAGVGVEVVSSSSDSSSSTICCWTTAQDLNLVQTPHRSDPSRLMLSVMDQVVVTLL